MSGADVTPSTDLETTQNAGVRSASDRSAKLIASLESFGLWTRIQHLQKPAVIVADEAILAAIPSKAISQGARQIPIRDIEQGRFPTPLNGPYFIVTTKDELAVKQRLRELLRARGLREEIYGALHDLVPMALADDGTLERAGLEAAWETFAVTRSLIITCTPRSGSQFLSRKLQENGIGAPREHIRPGIISLFAGDRERRPGGARFQPIFAGLVHHARQNGIFATKLISHFIRDLEESLAPAEWASLQDFAQRSRILYLLRSNKLLQGLSRDRAKSTQQYHVFADEKRAAYRERSEAWEYDFERILREIRALNKEEAYLMDWLQRLVEPARRVPVIYETMDVEAVVEAARSALGAPAAKAQTAMPTHVLRDELTENFAARFREDYRRTYRADAPDTHVAHWVDYDAAADALIFRTDPESLAE